MLNIMYVKLRIIYYYMMLLLLIIINYYYYLPYGGIDQKILHSSAELLNQKHVSFVCKLLRKLTIRVQRSVQGISSDASDFFVFAWN